MTTVTQVVAGPRVLWSFTVVWRHRHRRRARIAAIPALVSVAGQISSAPSCALKAEPDAFRCASGGRQPQLARRAPEWSGMKRLHPPALWIDARAAGNARRSGRDNQSVRHQYLEHRNGATTAPPSVRS